MDQIFSAVQSRLQQKVSELKWIDFDFGQLDAYELRPPVQFPCALIDIELPETREQGPGMQTCRCVITLRVAFEQPGQTHNKTPQQVKEKALGIYTILKKIHACLHGYGTSDFSKILRRSLTTERREDPLKVFSIRFETSFTETVPKDFVMKDLTPVVAIHVQD